MTDTAENEPKEDELAEQEHETEPDVDQGTHPVAMLGMVSGIASIFTVGCFCFVPATAPYLQGLFGLSAVGMSLWTQHRVRAGLWHESNRFQAKFALGFGVVGLCFAIFWYFFLGKFGWMPFIPQGNQGIGGG